MLRTLNVSLRFLLHCVLITSLTLMPLQPMIVIQALNQPAALPKTYPPALSAWDVVPPSTAALKDSGAISPGKLNIDCFLEVMNRKAEGLAISAAEEACGQSYKEEPIYLASRSQLARTFNFSMVSPTWESVAPTNMGSIYEFKLDPHYPRQRAWLVTDTGLWHTNNVEDAHPNWDRLLRPEDLQARYDLDRQHGCTAVGITKIIANPAKPGYFVLGIVTNVGDLPHGYLGCPGLTAITKDDGFSWTCSPIPACDLNPKRDTFPAACCAERDG